MLDTITFDELPKAVGDILDGIAEIKSLCEEIKGNEATKDAYMTIEELCAYHPDHPSHQTVRRWKRLGIIPYYKLPIANCQLICIFATCRYRSVT